MAEIAAAAEITRGTLCRLPSRESLIQALEAAANEARAPCALVTVGGSR
jgi:hypothetical protein